MNMIMGNCCRCIDEVPGGINIKGFNRATGITSWEHIGQLFGTLQNRHITTTRITTSILNNTLPVHYYVESNRDDIHATNQVRISDASPSARFPGRTSIWATPLSQNQFVTWESRVKYINMENGSSSLSSGNMGYISLPKNDVSGGFGVRHVSAGDPNVVGVPYDANGSGNSYTISTLGVSGTRAMIGEVSGGLLSTQSRTPQSSVICLNPFEAVTNIQKYRIIPQVLPETTFYNFRIPAWSGLPEQTVSFNHTDDANAVKAIFDNVAAIFEANVSGGPLSEDWLEIHITWQNADQQFVWASLEDSYTEPEPLTSRIVGYLTLHDSDTLIPYTSREQPRTTAFFDTYRRSQFCISGDGNIVLNQRFERESGTVSGVHNVYRWDGQNLEDMNSTEIRQAHGIKMNLRFAQDMILLTRDDYLGWYIYDLELSLINRWFRFDQATSTRYVGADYNPFPVDGGSIPSLHVVKQRNDFNGFRSLDVDIGYYSIPEDTPANANNQPISISKYDPWVSIWDTGDEVSMNSPFIIGDTERAYSGGISTVHQFNQNEAREYPVMKGTQGWTILHPGGITDNPWKSRFGFTYETRRVDFALPTSWRVPYDESTEFAIGLGSYQFPRAGQYTEWLPFDASVEDIETALGDTFGVADDLRYGPTNNVSFDNVYDSFFTPNVSPGIVQSMMEWEKAQTLEINYASLNSSLDSFKLADTNGCTGSFEVDPNNPGSAARSWSRYISSIFTYVLVRVRNKNTGFAQTSPSGNYMSATRWSDGLVEWKRSFGTRLDNNQETGCSMIMNPRGSTVVGWSQVPVEPELR